ncbi:hypothetical protein LCGC14_1169090 [marine sediment metagenome]|uniref:Uncharacterized protein n=1 Tax=marine sediment metagenome TaxID=412755 RepID=A0A0F9PVX2_9ZZZZ|nr:hypothetical protein [archaeon]HEC37779.1 hypothetical protein [bacterium]
MGWRGQKASSLPIIIGAFFLDSHIIIPRIDIILDSRTNSYILPFGPVIFNHQSETLTSGTLKYLSWAIAKKLTSEYVTSTSLALNTRFEASQTKLYSFISKEVNKQIITNKLFNSRLDTIGLSPSELIGKNIWLAKKYNNFLRASYMGVFSYATSGATTYSPARTQIEQFYNTKDRGTTIKYKEYNNGKKRWEFLGQTSFNLKITKSFLDSIGFSPWGKTTSLSTLIGDYYPKFKNDNVNNFKEKAKKIISRFGTDNKKVLIQPIWSTNDPNLGYQTPTTSTSLKNKIFLPNDNSVFEVDLDNPKEADYILEHISHLIGTYGAIFAFREYVDINSDSRYKDIPDRIERMKKYFEENRKVITLVDFEGYQKVESIFSGSSNWEQVLIDGYSTDSSGKTFFDDDVFKNFAEWDEVWVHKMSLSPNPGGSFWTNYFDYIKNGVTGRIDGRPEVMRRILGLNLGGERI